MRIGDFVGVGGKKNKGVLDPRDPFGNFRKDLDKLLSRAFQLFSGVSSINIDIKGEGDSVIISAELPGIEAKDISISINGNILTIRADREQELEEDKEAYYLRECGLGTSIRSLQLPFYVDHQDSVLAELDNGMLTIKILKPTEALGETKKIPVVKKK